jgi:hypothetical protein
LGAGPPGNHRTRRQRWNLFVLAWLLLLTLPGRSALSADPEPVPKPPPADPPKPGAIAQALQRGIAFLVKDQNADGSWGTAERTKDLNIYAPVPGGHQAFQSGDTALCVAALIQMGDDRAEVRRAIEKGEAWLLENLPKLRRATPDALYNVWSHGYGIQALVRMHGRLPTDKPRRQKIAEVIRGQIELLSRYESLDGGWGYYDFRVGSQRPASSSTSFTTATILIALHEAKQIGIDPSEGMLKRAIDSIHRQRKPDFTYIYGEYLKWRPMHEINLPGGSLGRSQVCNLALRLWKFDKITDEVLTIWLDRLFARNGWLDMGRKRPIPHESHFAVAGYFFYYGHYYAAGCIEQLPADKRPFYQDHLAAVLLRLQEEDGSWWDYPLYNYHQQWGTAMALMSLKRCRLPAEAVPRKGEPSRDGP